MPAYSIAGCDLNVSREGILIDTGVLVGAFLPSDPRHLMAQQFLEEHQDQFIVPVAVVVETWGFIVGSRKQRGAGLDMLAWLRNPGNEVLLVPQQESDVRRAHETADGLHVDCVDAFLLDLAEQLTECLNQNSAIAIATCDARDFLRCTAGFRFNIVHITAEAIEPMMWR